MRDLCPKELFVEQVGEHLPELAVPLGSLQAVAAFTGWDDVFSRAPSALRPGVYVVV